MLTNWRLFYRKNDAGAMEFAELLNHDGNCFLRKGNVFTHGTTSKIDSFEVTSDQLLKEGFELQREWVFDRYNRNYDIFKEEIRAVISQDPEFSDSNALAIITDSSFITIGFALHKFDDIESTDDEQLWIVDEWSKWNDDWHLDPAYRWLLAYGYDDHLEEALHSEFREQIGNLFQDILKSYADTKDILLIYIGDDDLGYIWSAECMDNKLANRMMKWI